MPTGRFIALGGATMKSFFNFVIIVIAMMIVMSCSDNKSMDKFFRAIRQVETGGMKDNGLGAIGDKGKSYGPYQIQYNYWKDANMKYGTWERCLTDEAYSREVMMKYLRRYAKDALEQGDWQTLARIHNGGPKGHTRTSTKKYWTKVYKELQK